MEAEAISPDVQACGDDNYTALVRLQEEVPYSSRRGKSTQCGSTHSVVAAVHHRLGPGKSTSFPGSFSLQARGYGNLRQRVIG